MLGVQGRRQGPGVWAGDGQSGLCGGAQAWGRPTDGAGDGQVRQKMVGLDDLNLVGHEPEPIAH